MRQSRVLFWIFIFSALTLVFSPLVGMHALSWNEVWTEGSRGAKIFWELRLPRACLAWTVGAVLSVCGMVFQALFRNPLASPDMLGVSTGAALGAVLSIRFGLVFNVLGLVSGLSVAAFLGAAAATSVIYWAGAMARGRGAEASLLLAGVAVSFLLGSLTLIVQYGGGYADAFQIMRWTMGSVQAVGFSSLRVVLPALALIAAGAFFFAPELDLLVCGETLAASRGAPVERLRKVLFFGVSLAVGLCVSVCGPIGFVGLMVPHICRRLAGNAHRPLASASILFGGAFLTLCDTASRTLWAPSEIPVGILTSCLGALFFLGLLLGRRKS